MAIMIPSRDISRIKAMPSNRQLFASPHPAGRQITAGFTYLQRISKAASYDVWFPDSLKRALETRLEAGQLMGHEQFPAQWAAVRQFELLQESGNHKIYDLDPSNIQRATLDLSRSMRAGGIRITVATLGRYAETSLGDELEILDHDLQERIGQMIHMLYLDQQSEEENAMIDTRLASHAWDYRTDLPHIGMVLGAQNLFRPQQALGRRHKQARRFFEIVGQLPHNHIVHDTAIGLQLPELNGENHWNYIASSDETLASFNHVLRDLFDKFNGVSLSRLHDREDAGAEIKPSTFHMRSYGHPLREDDLKSQRLMSCALH